MQSRTTVEQHEQLAHRHRPIIYLHSHERYYPCSVETYLQHVAMYFDQQQVLSIGQVYEDILGDPQRLLQVLIRAGVQPPERTLPLTRQEQERITLHLPVRDFELKAPQPAPIYCRVREYDDRYELVYMMLFFYNGAYRVCGCGWEVGQHSADWEHVTVTVLKETRQVVDVYYGSHGYLDGLHVSGRQIGMRGRHPLVWAAKGSHGTYPGTMGPRIVRFMCAANDQIDNGFAWQPSSVIVLPESGEVSDPHDLPPGARWVQYLGRWGDDGVSSPPVQSWWQTEPSVSNTNCRRTCCFSEIPDEWCCACWKRTVPPTSLWCTQPSAYPPPAVPASGPAPATASMV